MARSIVCLLALWGLLATAPAYAAKPEIVQVSPDTYLVTIQNKAGIFGSLPRTRQRAIAAANAFAAERGMTAIPVSMESTPAGGPGQWPTVEYQFRVVPEGDPEHQRTALVPGPDTTVQVDVRTDGPTAPATADPKPDLYSELIKLDDLRTRGILTEAEFQEQKERVLRTAEP